MVIYTLISLASFLVASLFQLIVVGWLVFGDPQGPLWVGFFAPLGFCLYLAGAVVGGIGLFHLRRRSLWLVTMLNGGFACAFVVACFAYVLIVGVLGVGAP